MTKQERNKKRAKINRRGTGVAANRLTRNLYSKKKKTIFDWQFHSNIFSGGVGVCFIITTIERAAFE